MTNDTDSVLLDIDSRGVARVTLNRPEIHNAIDDALIARLTAVLAELDGNAAVRTVLLAANGKSFCAGADFHWMRRMAGYSQAENMADAERLGEMLRRLNGLSKPTVALVQGGSYGGGVGLVACCDIAIAAETARFSLSEVKIGLIPATISPYVVRAIGQRAARRYFITGEVIDAAEARRLGLVHEVVPAAELEAAGERMVTTLRDGGPMAQAANKELIARVADRPVDAEMIADTARRIAEARATDEAAEGMAAFFAKRPPAWR